MHSLEIIRKMNNQAASAACKSNLFEKKSNNNQRLLNIIKALDSMLTEAPDLPHSLKQSIILTKNNLRRLLVVKKREVISKAIQQ